MLRRLLTLCFIAFGAGNLRADDKKEDPAQKEREKLQKMMDDFEAKQKALREKLERLVKEIEEQQQENQRKNGEALEVLSAFQNEWDGWRRVAE